MALVGVGAGTAGPGEVFRIDPGHDAWTVGDEPVVLLDFAGAGTYAAHGPT
ncbi:MAG: hypothetical protein L0I76_21880 [Pseudonocardia sp.]|nr:hypothetical protein [Pseudonocardia sp.]